MVTEDMPFGDDVLVFRLCQKIFACMPLTGPNILQLKCDPNYSVELRDRYSVIEPAYHWNKKYWIQLPCDNTLSSDLIESLIRHSYLQVRNKLPRKLRATLPPLPSELA